MSSRFVVNHSRRERTGKIGAKEHIGEKRSTPRLRWVRRWARMRGAMNFFRNYLEKGGRAG
jgi:hypothetical protein